jgi:hypothetical protein
MSFFNITQPIGQQVLNSNSVSDSIVLLQVYGLAAPDIWTQQAYIPSSLGLAPTYPYAVSISYNGNIAVAISYYYLYVYERTGTQWTIAQSILNSTNDSSFSIKVSSDGDVIVVGSPSYNTEVGGAIYIYNRYADQTVNWTLTNGPVSPAVYTGTPLYGSAVDISYNKNVIVVGGSFDNNGIGAVWIYSYVGTTLTEVYKIVPSDTIGSFPEFGSSVSIGTYSYATSTSTTQNYLVAIGGPGDNSTGAVWIYHGNNVSGAWTEKSKLTATGTDMTSASFGASVSLSRDTSYLVVGGPNTVNNMGGAWIFLRTSDYDTGTYIQQGLRLLGLDVSVDGNGTAFGKS